MANPESEHLGGLEQIYERLEALNPETGQWLRLVIEVIEPFETESYTANPETLDHVLPNLDNDTSDLIVYLIGITPENEEERTIILTELEIELKTNRPVIAYALRGVFDHFGINSERIGSQDTTAERARFKMPNILFSNRADMERFYKAFGLEEDFSKGKGGHHGWRDSDGVCIVQSHDSKKAWVKNIIKELLDKSIPIEKIKEACDKCNIPFTIL